MTKKKNWYRPKSHKRRSARCLTCGKYCKDIRMHLMYKPSHRRYGQYVGDFM